MFQKDSCACKPLLIDLHGFYYRCSQENESHFVFKTQKGIYVHTYMARAQSVGTARIQDLSMLEVSLNNRNTLILPNMNVTVHGHNMETS